VRLDKEQQEKARQEKEQRVRDQQAQDLDLAMRVANSSPAPGQELTPEAQQLKDAATAMLETTDPSFVADYVRRTLARNEQTRRDQRGSGTGK
jgi:hypothetical protein